MQAFLKVIACKNRLSQRLAVAHGNQMQAIKRLLFRMAPEDDWFCRFMVDLPIPERDDYDFKAQPLRLMNREDTDRILSIRCGNCFPAARFVPPFRKRFSLRSPSGYIRTPYPRKPGQKPAHFRESRRQKGGTDLPLFHRGTGGKGFAGQRRLPVEKPEFRHQISLSTLDRNIKRSARSSDLRGSSGNATKKP